MKVTADAAHRCVLERLVALCPGCHELKHTGLASKRGRWPAVVEHLAEVNGWTTEEAELYLEVAFEQWAARSRHLWTPYDGGPWASS